MSSGRLFWLAWLGWPAWLVWQISGAYHAHLLGGKGHSGYVRELKRGLWDESPPPFNIADLQSGPLVLTALTAWSLFSGNFGSVHLKCTPLQ